MGDYPMRITNFAKFLFASAWTLYLPTVCVAEEINGSQFFSGNWEGAAYTLDGSNEFSHCAISAYYPGYGASLVFYLSKDYTMSLAVGAESAIFSGATQFPVVARVDRRPAFYGTAEVVSSGDVAFLSFADLKATIETMKRGRTLLLESQYGEFSFSLDGTYRALDSAYLCAAEYYAYDTQLNTEETPKVEPVAWTPTAEQTAVMYQISTKMIADAGQTDFEYLTSDQLVTMGISKLSNGVAWVASDGAFFGGVLVGRLNGQEINLVSENASDMAMLTMQCMGDIATVNRNYEVDGFPTSELVTLCTDDQKISETTMMKMNVNGVSVETIMVVERLIEPVEGGPDVVSIPAEKAAMIAASFVSD